MVINNQLVQRSVVRNVRVICGQSLLNGALNDKTHARDVNHPMLIMMSCHKTCLHLQLNTLVRRLQTCFALTRKLQGFAED